MSGIAQIAFPPVSHGYKSHYDLEDLKRNIDGYFDACDKVGRHYTVTDLSLFLNVSDQTMRDWGNESDSPKAWLIKNAKQRILSQAQQKLISGKGCSIPGIIFWLKNTFHWRDVTEINNPAAGAAIDLLRDFISKERSEIIDVTPRPPACNSRSKVSKKAPPPKVARKMLKSKKRSK